MTKKYDDEATRYEARDNEETKFGNRSDNASLAGNNSVESESTPGSVSRGWKRAAAGAASGLLIGGVSTFLMGMKRADLEVGEVTAEEDQQEELSHPEWADGNIEIAATVNDGMSFGEAFAAARAEVGPGGCFEWHGNVYATYTAEEWSSMTAEQRAEFSGHFSWNHIDHSESQVAQHQVASAPSQAGFQAQTDGQGADDIEIVSVTHTEGNSNPHVTTGQETIQANITPAGSEVEILGVVHDNETGANIGGMSVDGHEVILIDVDGDMEFDFMASDLNGDGRLDPDEMVDIQSQGLTVNDLGGLSNPSAHMLGDNDAVDYSSDAVYEG